MATNDEVVGLNEHVLSALAAPGAAARVAELQRQAEADDLLAKRKANAAERQREYDQLALETPLLQSACDRALEKALAAERALEDAREQLRQANGILANRRSETTTRTQQLEAIQRESASPLIAAALEEFELLEQRTRRRNLDRVEEPVKGADGQPLWNLILRRPITKTMTNTAAILSTLNWIRECMRQLRHEIPLMALTDDELRQKIKGMRDCVGDAGWLSE